MRLIYLSDSLLLVYRNATDFYILILYPASLLNSLMSSNRFFGGIFRIFYIQYHAIRKQWQLFFFLSNLNSFYFFFCLIAVARTSGTMLNKSGKSGHPCLVPDLRGNAFSFSLLSMILVVGLSYLAFVMLNYVLCAHLFRVFIINRC